MIIVIMYFETFKTDVIVFIGNVIRDGPFNLKGGLCFFSKKIFLFRKKYSDFGGGKKKKSDSEFLSYNLMLNSRKKNSERNKKP